LINGIGLDIVEKQRIKEAIDRLGERFIRRILTKREISLIPEGEMRKIEYISGRFAAKEAFSKAIGTGIGLNLSFQDLEILREANGKPIIIISGQWCERNDPMNKHRYHVSITHEKKYALAQVIIEG
jgi:holo-[acyl-carrier protein] synthase